MRQGLSFLLLTFRRILVDNAISASYTCQWFTIISMEVDIMKSSKILEITQIGVVTAIICAVSQLPGIPLPGGVPMTLQTLIIPLAGILLGAKNGTLATLVYVLLGAVGLPVFSGFSGGFGVIAGMTGGFIISFPLLALFAGLSDHIGSVMTKNSKIPYYGFLLLGLLLGAVLNYVVGTIWFMLVAKTSFLAGFTACVAPFIPTAILKIILAAIVGPAVKRVLIRANALSSREAIA